MRKAEIVIIGGGVIGASVAFHLAKRGAKDVLILEREEVQGKGSTGVATGGVRAQFETDINIRMSLYSLDFFREWEFDCEYEPSGYLFFATNEKQFAYLKENAANQRTVGVKDVDIVDVETIEKLVPGINSEDIVGGCFGKHDGFINPLAVMLGFTGEALRSGVRIEFGVCVTSVVADKDRVRSVVTNTGLIECEKVVLCAGAWAKEIAGTLGLELPVDPMRRQIVWARSKEPLPADLPMVIDIGTGFHFRPAREFRREAYSASNETTGRDILFAYPDPEQTPSLDTSFDESFIDKVYERARHRAAFMGDAECIRERCRAGLYEVTPDHHAILGGCDVEGLYLANGFSGHGVMHSPAAGRAVSEIILDGCSSFLDISCLHLNRFADGKMLRETAFI